MATEVCSSAAIQFGKVQNSGTFPNLGTVFPNSGTVPEFRYPAIVYQQYLMNSIFISKRILGWARTAEFSITFALARSRCIMPTQLRSGCLGVTRGPRKHFLGMTGSTSFLFLFLFSLSCSLPLPSLTSLLFFLSPPLPTNLDILNNF